MRRLTSTPEIQVGLEWLPRGCGSFLLLSENGLLHLASLELEEQKASLAHRKPSMHE